MVLFAPTTSPAATFLIVEYEHWETKDRKQKAYLVDSELVPALKALGNLHPRVKQRPEDFAPVLRRRHPLTGGSKEVRLPVIVSVLKRSSNPLTLVQDMAQLLDECAMETKNISRTPRNGIQADCRHENWVSKIETSELERLEIDTMAKELESHQGEMIEGVVRPSIQKEIDAFKRKHHIPVDIATEPQKTDPADKILKHTKPSGQEKATQTGFATKEELQSYIKRGEQ